VQLRDVAVVLRDGWRMVLTGVLVGLAAAAALTILTPPTYLAHARVYFTVTRPANPDVADPGGVTILHTADLQTLTEQIDSPIIQDPLAKATPTPDGVWFDVSLTVPETNSWVDVTARSSDPKVAAQAANAAGPVLAGVAARFAPLLSQPATSIVAEAITPAVVPAAPNSPDVRRNLVLGLLLGLAAGVGAVLARRQLDSRVHNETDLGLSTTRPVLVAIPHDPVAAGPALAFEQDPHGGHAESIRRLRTNLLFIDVTSTRHAFVLTSAMPGEGKTTTVLNLARAMAESGARTLVVDADLRNPSVAKSLAIEGAVGLTTVLLRRIPFHEAVQPWGSSRLHVLPAGPIPPNPSELLGSRRMAELMSLVTAQYDFVLVDSPPLVPVIDAVLLQRLTGSLVLVVAAERTRRKDLEAALTSLDTVGSEPAGIVLNFVPSSPHGYRYGYYRYGSARPSRPARARSRATSGRDGRSARSASGSYASATQVPPPWLARGVGEDARGVGEDARDS
jgi:succinoglycan biosynthesis transport protein ExoP